MKPTRSLFFPGTLTVHGTRRSTGDGTGRALICGGGPAGSLAAVYLARAGYVVDVCEARALPDPLGRNLDRSYHLAMSHRGMSAVEQARFTGCYSDHCVCKGLDRSSYLV